MVGTLRMAVVFACTLLLLAEGMGAVYVVDNRHPNASDANPGTADRPFKTINRAAQLVQPGDTVIVKAGIYREHVRLTRSGKAGLPITFVADPIGSVVITGADIATDWERADNDAPDLLVCLGAIASPSIADPTVLWWSIIPTMSGTNFGGERNSSSLTANFACLP